MRFEGSPAHLKSTHKVNTSNNRRKSKSTEKQTQSAVDDVTTVKANTSSDFTNESPFADGLLDMNLIKKFPLRSGVGGREFSFCLGILNNEHHPFSSARESFKIKQ